MIVYQNYSENPSVNEAKSKERLSRAERRRIVREGKKASFSDLQCVIESGLMGLGIEKARESLQILMEEEANEKCGGPKGKHNPDRQAFRHGTVPGKVALGGIWTEMERPRLRSIDGSGEIVLETYKAAQDPKFYDEAVMTQAIAGVPQRMYAKAINPFFPLQDGVNPLNVSKSTVNRRFVAKTQQLLEEFLSRRLDDERYLVVFIDGKKYGDSQIMVAVGIDEAGDKHVLGLWEGATENKQVCMAFLEDMMYRGLSVEDGLLVVIDGGKGIRAAIDCLWGNRVLVQRCQYHKERNVLEKLPESKRRSVKAMLHQAWNRQDAATAGQMLHNLAWQLEEDGEEAAANSVREGLEETLTCIRLGLPLTLQKSLTNTNIIESTFSCVWQDLFA